jgi:2-oxoglutarate dehydrogenase E1 component
MSLDWKDFQGVNAGYALELYERFLADPRSVDDETRALFATGAPPDVRVAASTPAPAGAALAPHLVVGAVNLAQSIRRFGHLSAQIDPLSQRPMGDPALLAATHGVSEADLRALPPTLVDSDVTVGAESMWDVVERLRTIYCSTTGYDIAHIFDAEEREWFAEAIETARYRAPHDPIDPVALLDRLTDVEVFERFLHRTFPTTGCKGPLSLSCSAAPSRLFTS